MSNLVRYSDGAKAVLLISQEERDILYARAKELRDKKTPPKYIKNKGGYDYAEFAYMLDEMDKAHPLRSEVVVTDEFNEKYLIYRISVVVTDLTTGESRPGCDAHPVVAYNSKADGGDMKDISTIRELMGNAYKAALSKALRNAYSNFGVSSDLYQTQLAQEPTKEQKEKFWLWDKFIDEKISNENIIAWWNKIKIEWDRQTAETAEKYLNSLEAQISKLKEKYNV